MKLEPVLAIALILWVGMADPWPAGAQPSAPPRTERGQVSIPAAEPSPDSKPAPYEPDLLQLADIIGSLAYLRHICNGHDATLWHQKMLSLVETEGRTPAIRDRLVGAYNAGFKAYASAHRTCLAGTEEASVRLSRDGERLARRLAGRYGG